MKKIIFILMVIISFSEHSFAQSAWFELQSGYTSHESVQDVYFFNAETGFVVGSFSLFAKTTNGGLNWTKFILRPGNHFSTIYFLNNNTGWISGMYYNGSDNVETVWRTTNAGLNWDSAYFENYASAYDIQFINGNTGYIAGKYIKKSTNGGVNWFIVDEYSSMFMNKAIYFINSMTGWASKTYYNPSTYINVSKIIKTTNGGQNWNDQILDSNLSNNSFQDIVFVNDNTGYAANILYGVYKTTNGGQNWSIVNYLSSNYKLFFLNENTGWVCSSDYIRKTTNAGINWYSEFIYNGCFLNGIFFINELTGWTGGNTNISQCKLFKTTNGGLTTINNFSSEVPYVYELEQNYPNPFNAVTRIKFKVTSEGVRSQKTGVSLKVYDLNGREIRKLVNEELNPGTYEVQFDAGDLPSGVYFYRMEAGKFIETRKLILLK
ncbi:MAG: T9SS type A sorting domain-containing protein [Ignavibacteria bacterium]|nr:T9SS type A sorting domain-containing protein [Ignavibacteria bacterium]